MNPKMKNTANEDFTEYGSLEYTNPKMSTVYGPVQSRRFGWVLGVNLLGQGQKVCSFDCPYCDLGPTNLRLNRIRTDIAFPSLEEIESSLREGLLAARAQPKKLEMISLAGNGEPTLHPLFSEAVDVIIKVRDQIAPGTPIGILTNGANLDTRKVVEALNKLDERIVKIDAGNERAFKTVNAPLVRASVSKIIAGTRQLKDVIIQSFFVQGAVDNTQGSDIDDWMEVIGLIKPKAVHIHGMSRVPAARGLKRVEEDELYMIAGKLERRSQIRALVFP